MHHFTTAAVAPAVVLLCSAVRAQDLEPRAYSHSPTGLNFLIVGYALRQWQHPHRSVVAARQRD